MLQTPSLVKSEQISVKDMVKYGAVDGSFFTNAFFPRMARQVSPKFHVAMWNKLDSPSRMINFEVFRGGAKTSLLRSYTAKRVSYGLARTILYIGKNEGHAMRSLNWLRSNVMTNSLWSGAFQLTPGKKWQDTELQINHGVLGHVVHCVAMGINGSVRGINFDDWRPDLIILDDIIDDENSNTTEQREKIKNRVYGAIKQSLAPRSEAPTAKMVMLQTPLHPEDASSEAMGDAEWDSASYGCWTEKTKDKALHLRESAWPERWTSEELRKEKTLAIQRNKASIFAREMECVLITPEDCAFKAPWLKTYQDIELPKTGVRVLVIDPVPPPSPAELEKGLVKKDYECLHVVQRTGNDYYSVEVRSSRGHNPSWTIATLFELLEKHNVRKIMVESVAYQRTLAWLIRQEMESRGTFWQVVEFTDNRNKYNKIVDSLNGIASGGHLYVQENSVDLISQFRDYPSVSHDDELETLALGCMELSGLGYQEELFGDVGMENHGETIDYAAYCNGAP